MNEDNMGNSLLQIIQGQMAPSAVHAVEPKNIRYALYARKSTETDDRQVRSIPDQIKDCIELVIQPNKILFDPRHDVFEERKSAKEAGTRPVFRDMIQQIKDGKYDGVISWHYDRLARNMKEAGEIIDLLDRGIIKDLRLAKATFENTPNGKMILGISFVLSKHYSDHLSESVLRGNKSSTEQGRILRHQVHGYRISGDRRLIADGDNYLLIEQAFRMRIANKPLKEIADFLNSNGYQVWRRKSGHTISKFDVDKVSKLMREPIYAGVIVYGKDVVKITDKDPDFTPMLSEDDFLKINKVNNFLSYAVSAARRVAPDNVSEFLRDSVICFDCKRYMGTSITVQYPDKDDKTKKRSYFRFRCLTAACPMHGSGPRGSILLDYILDFLDTHLFTTQSNYNQYRADAERSLEEKTAKLDSARRSLAVFVSKKRKEYDDALAMAANKDSEYASYYTPEHLKSIKKELADYEDQLGKVKAEIESKSTAIKTFDEYLELYENIANLLRSTHGLSQSDEIVRIFFSNFTVKGTPYGKKMKQKQWSVIDHCLAEPFNTFVENDEFSNGRG